jgi:hypothetical protein
MMVQQLRGPRRPAAGPLLPAASMLLLGLATVAAAAPCECTKGEESDWTRIALKGGGETYFDPKKFPLHNATAEYDFAVSPIPACLLLGSSRAICPPGAAWSLCHRLDSAAHCCTHGLQATTARLLLN